LHTFKKLYTVVDEVYISNKIFKPLLRHTLFLSFSFLTDLVLYMKSPIRLFTAFILAFGLSGWFSLVSATQSDTSEISKYSDEASKPSILLKWPRGSLIFPESNDPNKTQEVFLLSEAFTSQSEIKTLHHHLGLQFFSRKNYKEAKAEYLKALKYKPRVPVIYSNLGLIYFNSKSYKSAEDAYRKALQLDPGYAPAIAKLALTLAAQRKYTLAEKKFRQAIKVEPSNAEHHLNMGHFYFYLKKDYKGAKSSYQKALKLNSRLVKAKINLRDINLKFRKSKNKESDFENSWGSDFDYDGEKTRGSSENQPNYPEESDIAGTWDEENTQNPLF
jgi:tetratricopeptide (TPR) repeat protein